MSFDIEFIIDKLPYMLSGLKMTVIISVCSMVLSLIIGMLGAVIRSMNVPVLSGITVAYVEFFRNTPLFVQIFLIYFGLPSLGITLSALTTGILMLSIWGGAYAIENFRGGLESVSKQLVEAGSSLGMSKLEIYRHVMIPIGFRVSFSSFSNTAISLVKNSSFLSGIGLVELTFTALDTVSVYFKTFEMFFSIGVMYLVLIWGFAVLFRAIERKMDFTRRRGS